MESYSELVKSYGNYTNIPLNKLQHFIEDLKFLGVDKIEDIIGSKERCLSEIVFMLAFELMTNLKTRKLGEMFLKAQTKELIDNFNVIEKRNFNLLQDAEKDLNLLKEEYLKKAKELQEVNSEEIKKDTNEAAISEKEEAFLRCFIKKMIITNTSTKSTDTEEVQQKNKLLREKLLSKEDLYLSTLINDTKLINYIRKKLKPKNE